MSLINQMLQDLEKRRATAVPMSPLSGVTPSGAVLGSDHRINYGLLAVILILVVALAFLLGANGNRITRILPVAIQPASIHAQPNTLNAQLSAPVYVDKEPAAVNEAASVVDNAAVVNKPSVVKEVAASRPGLVTEKTSHEVAQAKPDTALPAMNQTAASTSPEVTTTQSAAHNVTATAAESTATGQTASVAIKPGADTDSSATEPVLAERAAAPEQVIASVTPQIQKQDRPYTDRQRAELAFQEAVSLMESGKEEAAITSLEVVLELSPAHERGREILASVLVNRGRAVEASSLLEAGLALNPRASALARLYGRILLSEGAAAQAIAVLEKAAPPLSADPEYYALLGAIYQRAGQYAQAAHVYEGLLRMRSGVANWWLGLALARESSDNADQALSAYTRARQAGGLSAEVAQFVTQRIEVLRAHAATVSADKAAAGNKKPQSIFEGQF